MVANAIQQFQPEQPKQSAQIVTRSKPRSIFDMNAQQIDTLKLLAKMYASSAMGQRISEPDAFMIMLKGIELGFEPMASMDLIEVIQGKPVIKPQGMLALVYASAELANLTIAGDDKSCTVTMHRKGKSAHTEVFTMNDADGMGLASKPNWKKMPAIMLKWRAISACARIVFPDLVQGVYLNEELNPDLEEFQDAAPQAIAPQIAAKNITALPQPAPAPAPTTPEMDAIINEPLPAQRGNAFENMNSVMPEPAPKAEPANTAHGTIVKIIVKKAKNKSLFYELYSEKAFVTTIWTRKLFREAGYDVEMWIYNEGQPETQNTYSVGEIPVTIAKINGNETWTLVSVEPAPKKG